MEQYKKKDLRYYVRKIWKDYICDWADTVRRKCRKIKYKIKYLFFPYNVVKIKTLDRSWNESDEMLIHSCFQILTDFVEHQCMPSSHAQLVPFNIEEQMESYKDWPEKDKEPMRKGLEEQNRVTQEILDLYNWWKKREAFRLANDPLNEIDELTNEEASLGGSEVCRRDEYGDPILWELKFNNCPKRTEIYKRAHKFEEDCNKEDEEMLIRLMKIRKCLWT